MAAVGEEQVGSFVGEHVEQQLSFLFSLGSRAVFSRLMCVDSIVVAGNQSEKFCTGKADFLQWDWRDWTRLVLCINLGNWHGEGFCLPGLLDVRFRWDQDAGGKGGGGWNRMKWGLVVWMMWDGGTAQAWVLNDLQNLVGSFYILFASVGLHKFLQLGVGRGNWWIGESVGISVVTWGVIMADGAVASMFKTNPKIASHVSCWSWGIKSWTAEGQKTEERPFSLLDFTSSVTNLSRD